jgi:hypothetical protein
LFDLNITKDLVKSVARHLSGSAGLGRMDPHMLQQMLLRFGKSSRVLRKAVAKFADWPTNSFLSWAAY